MLVARLTQWADLLGRLLRYFAGVVLAWSCAAWFAPPLCAQPSLKSEVEALRRQVNMQQTLIEELMNREKAFNAMDDETSPNGLSKSSPQFGYDKGFFISSAGGDTTSENIPYLLRFNSRLQLRHVGFASNGPNPDENDFEFERARLLFRGYFLTPDLSYFIQLDGDSDQSEVLDLLDYYVTFDFGREWFGYAPRRIGFKAGKWKLPFNRARAESGFKLQFTDRSMASAFFDINRSIAVGLFGRLLEQWQPIHWEIAVANGFRTEGFRSGRTGELDRNFAYAGRVFCDLVGEWGADGEPDLSFHEFPAVRVGAGMAYTRVNREGAREFSRQRVVDSGVLLVDLLPADVDAYNTFFYAMNADFKYRGFSFHSEYYFRHLTEFSGAPVSDLFDHGFLLQAGYFLIPKKLEIIARWSRIVGDSETLGLHDQSADEVAGGLGWYFHEHNARLVFDVTHLNGSPVNDPTLNIRAGDDGWLFRTQLQFWF